MQHASLQRAPGSFASVDRFRQAGTLAATSSRSARTELIMREVAKLQAQAAQLAAAVEDGDGLGADMEESGRRTGPPCSAEIRHLLRARLERNTHFPADLFSDPAWDMLLELYAAELDQVRVSVTSLCIASNAPTSTALRWISALERKNLIERRPDPLDGRRFFLSLTRGSVEMFERYFAATRPGRGA